MNQLILFIIIYLIIFLTYRFIFLRKKKNKKKKKEKLPVEINYLVGKYKIDLKKIDYNKLLTLIALISSLDITILVFIFTVIDNSIIAIISVIVLVIPIILISYGFLGKYYKKKGLIKDE